MPVPTQNAGVAPEVPPWQMAFGDQTAFLVTSEDSFLCLDDISFLDSSGVTFPDGGCSLYLSPGMGTLGPDDAPLGQEPWRRNYYGAFSGQVLTLPDGPALVTVNHGENKNVMVDGVFYPSTVNTDVPSSCWSGYDATTQTWIECWDAYNAFITLAHAPMAPDGRDVGGATVDEGPIVWSSAGLMDSTGTKTSLGVRHPTSLVDGDFLYVFYMDESYADEGIRVARSPLAALPSPLGFSCWDGTAFEIPALPVGYDVANVPASYEAPGPACAALFPEDGFDSVRFSVAPLAGSSLYLGVEERTSDTLWELVFRTSTDLQHWSGPTSIPGINAPDWDDALAPYPILVAADGEAGGLLDPGQVFVLGSASAVPARFSVSLSASAP